jgi:hypothetical protein
MPSIHPRCDLCVALRPPPISLCDSPHIFSFPSMYKGARAGRGHV